MGCAPSGEAQKAVTANGTESPEIAPLQRTKTREIIKVNRWPKPCPPGTTKDEIFNPIEFKEWNQRAVTVKNYGIPNDFQTLARLLCDGSSTNLQRVRVIYMWVTSQDCHAVEPSIQVDLNSPLGFLAALKKEVASYANLFLKICTAANVPCVTIKGFAKGVGYHPGQKMNLESFGASWNAVLIGKYWRLIDVHWGARFITGDDKKDDWKLIDSDTSAAVEKSQTMTYDSDDFYFLADPDKLIYSHYPDDVAWQLLDNPIAINQFEQQAFIKRHFFKLGLSIKSHPLAIIECPEGETDIEFALPMHSFVTFAYKLFAVKSSNVEKSIVSNASKLSQFVIQQTKNKIISFNLSFPSTGQFLIELYATAEHLDRNAGKKSNFMNHVCSYVINCTRAKPNCQALPKTASLKGFGPGIDTIRKSLVALSHQSGVILTSTGQVEVRFRMENGLVDFAHFLHSNSYSDDQLENYCVHRIVNDEVIFSVNLPTSGDYTLDIFGELESADDKNLPHICSYLIRCNKPGITNPPFANTIDNMFGRRADRDYISKKRLRFRPEDPFIISDSGEVVIEIESDPSITFQGVLELKSQKNETEPMNNHVFYERSNNLGKLSLTLPKPGFYRLGVFAREKQGSGKPKEVFNYLINCTSAHLDLIQYPVAFADWTDDCVLYEPKQGLLPIDEEINFSVSIPGAQSVFVVRPGEANEEYEKVCPLVKSPDDEDTWEGSVKTGQIAGDLQLAVVYKDANNPQGLLKFEVLTKEETAQLLQGVKDAAKDADDQDQRRLKEKEEQLMKERHEREARLQRELKDIELDRKRAAQAEADAEAQLLALTEKTNQIGADDEEKVRAEQSLRHAREEAEERKRERIRKQLKVAIKQRNKGELVKALRLFEENEIPDIDGDYLEGQELLQYFHLRSDLLKAIQVRAVPKLQQALDAVRKSSRDLQYKLELETARAERILESLRHIEKLRHAIMKLDQRTIAEIKNYSSPPEEVHQIFKATLLLLGTPLKSTEKWIDCLVHIGKMGRESLKRRINTFNMASVSRETADRANQILKPYSKQQVRNVSSGAAAFYVWSMGVITEVIAKEQEEEDSFLDAENLEDDDF